MSYNRKLNLAFASLIATPFVLVVGGVLISSVVVLKAQINTPSALQTPLPPYPVNPSGVQATPITGTATGTTASIAVTLAGVAGKTTYLCGYLLAADATAATEGAATITGVVTGTMNFRQSVAALSAGTALTPQAFSPCIPANAVNTAITVNSVAAGAGGNAAGYAWGFQL